MACFRALLRFLQLLFYGTLFFKPTHQQFTVFFIKRFRVLLPPRSCVKKGLEVHCVVIKVGFDSDVFVNNTLVLFYGNHGNLEAVEKVFDEMPEKDIISWNTVIRVLSNNNYYFKVIHLFSEMVLFTDFKPNEATMVSVLPVCASTGDVITTSCIHCYAIKVGLDSKVKVGNAFIDAYGKSREVELAIRLFDEMVEKNNVSWNAILTSFGYNGCYIDAFHSFRLMIKYGIKLNSIVVSTILSVFVELELFQKGKEVHDSSVRTGRSTDASNVCKNVVSWNTMIANLSQNNLDTLHLIDF